MPAAKVCLLRLVREQERKKQLNKKSQVILWGEAERLRRFWDMSCLELPQKQSNDCVPTSWRYHGSARSEVEKTPKELDKGRSVFKSLSKHMSENTVRREISFRRMKNVVAGR